MPNKKHFHRYLYLALLLTIILTILLGVINYLEYRTYRHNFNQKIENIINVVIEKYPDLTEKDVIKILNEPSLRHPLRQYGFLEEDDLIKTNHDYHIRFLIINVSFIFLSLLIIISLFLKYNHHMDIELASITKYIEEINKKNYTLKIDEISEDELSILKNEIYKVTVMLKESAENARKDKKELKQALEDISHQIKTPLTSILIILDNILDNPDMPLNIREDFISDIKREVGNLNLFIQDILKLSAFDVNTITFHSKTVKLKSVITDALKKVEPLCDLKNVKVDLDVQPNITLKCDRYWEVEALMNIIKNGIEHSSSHLKIETKSNQVYTMITIKDDGMGIAKKDMPHIFERFYKANPNNSDGSGIGLALAKTIIEKDNGTISLESTKDGTTFIIKYYNL